MTPHTNIAPAATLVAQPSDKYSASHPELISLLIQQAMQNERKQVFQQQQQQQKSYVSALVGKYS